MNSGDAVKHFLQEVRETTGGSKGEPGLIVGLDTEWHVVFHDDGYRNNRMVVLQM